MFIFCWNLTYCLLIGKLSIISLSEKKKKKIFCPRLRFVLPPTSRFSLRNDKMIYFFLSAPKMINSYNIEFHWPFSSGVSMFQGKLFLGFDVVVCIARRLLDYSKNIAPHNIVHAYQSAIFLGQQECLFKKNKSILAFLNSKRTDEAKKYIN